MVGKVERAFVASSFSVSPKRGLLVTPFQNLRDRNRRILVTEWENHVFLPNELGYTTLWACSICLGRHDRRPPLRDWTGEKGGRWTVDTLSINLTRLPEIHGIYQDPQRVVNGHPLTAKGL